MSEMEINKNNLIPDTTDTTPEVTPGGDTQEGGDAGFDGVNHGTNDGGGSGNQTDWSEKDNAGGEHDQWVGPGTDNNTGTPTNKPSTGDTTGTNGGASNGNGNNAGNNGATNSGAANTAPARPTTPATTTAPTVTEETTQHEVEDEKPATTDEVEKIEDKPAEVDGEEFEEVIVVNTGMTDYGEARTQAMAHFATAAILAMILMAMVVINMVMARGRQRARAEAKLAQAGVRRVRNGEKSKGTIGKVKAQQTTGATKARRTTGVTKASKSATAAKSVAAAGKAKRTVKVVKRTKTQKVAVKRTATE